MPLDCVRSNAPVLLLLTALLVEHRGKQRQESEEDCMHTFGCTRACAGHRGGITCSVAGAWSLVIVRSTHTRGTTCCMCARGGGWLAHAPANHINSQYLYLLKYTTAMWAKFWSTGPAPQHLQGNADEIFRQRYPSKV